MLNGERNLFRMIAVSFHISKNHYGIVPVSFSILLGAGLLYLSCCALLLI